jgi:hypothetical protein
VHAPRRIAGGEERFAGAQQRCVARLAGGQGLLGLEGRGAVDGLVVEQRRHAQDLR